MAVTRPSRRKVETKREDGQIESTRTVQSLTCARLSDAFGVTHERPKRVPPLFYCLRALRRFEQAHGRAARPADSDAAELVDELLPADLLQRVLRGQRVELSCVAAVLGGVLGQELVRRSMTTRRAHQHGRFASRRPTKRQSTRGCCTTHKRAVHWCWRDGGPCVQPTLLVASGLVFLFRAPALEMKRIQHCVVD